MENCVLYQVACGEGHEAKTLRPHCALPYKAPGPVVNGTGRHIVLDTAVGSAASAAAAAAVMPIGYCKRVQCGTIHSELDLSGRS